METLTKLAKGGTINSDWKKDCKCMYKNYEWKKNLTHGLKSRLSVVNWEPAVSDLNKSAHSSCMFD